MIEHHLRLASLQQQHQRAGVAGGKPFSSSQPLTKCLRKRLYGLSPTTTAKEIHDTVHFQMNVKVSCGCACRLLIFLPVCSPKPCFSIFMPLCQNYMDLTARFKNVTFLAANGKHKSR